ncbi:MAG: transglutaminase domain-containing protein [Clostridia bacterium]|nr:transglutaminase domain-containing protein [Clostridia bacterium]
MIDRRKLADGLVSAAAAVMLAFSGAWMLLDMMGIPANRSAILLACCGMVCFAELCRAGRKGILSACALALAAWIAAALTGHSPMAGLLNVLRVVASSATGGELQLADCTQAATVLISFFFAASLAWMCRMSGGVYPALTLSLIVMMGSWYVTRRLDSLCAVLVVAALALLFARAGNERMPHARALPAALLAGLLAFALLPAGNPTWAPLENAAQKVRELFSDYFMFTDARSTYSISSDGLQPMGEMLGGPADPLPDLRMKVETDETVLLRGSTRRTYTTYSWVENAVNSRYVFIDPMRRGTRDRIFDADRFQKLDAAAAFAQKRIGVTMLADGISALYIPGRLQDLSAELDLVTYFSTNGEVFLTRGVKSGDRYTAVALVPTQDQEAMARLLAQAAVQGDDERWQQARESYLQLPKGIEDGVYDIARRLTAGLETPYEKALAIENWLVGNHTYNLNVSYPPRGRDFVSYFLLDSREGYCSYYASAMAVLCRIAGLPARYAEGYLVPAGADGVTTVTGENAHAWAEVYFEGAGWVAFNPTPGMGHTGSAGGAPERGGEDRQEPEGGESPEDGQDAEQDGEPEEGEAPPEDEENPEDEESPEDEENPEDEEDPEAEEEPKASNRLWLLLVILLILAALTVLCVRRLRAHDPERIAAANAPDALAVWYRALLTLLETRGIKPDSGETPGQFAGRVVEQCGVDPAFSEVTQAILRQTYGAAPQNAQQVRKARALYRKMIRQSNAGQKAQWTLHVLRFGIGDFRVIP